MCIFCDIIDHKIPSYTVYEDEFVLAILDISQVTYGHTIVMPKKHVQNMLEADQETLHHCMDAAQLVAKTIMERTNAKGVNLLCNTNEAAGQTVNHLHIHVIPRYDENDAVEIKFNEPSVNKIEEVHALLTK